MLQGIVFFLLCSEHRHHPGRAVTVFSGLHPAEHCTRQIRRKKFSVESGADAGSGRIPPVYFLFHMDKERAEAGG